MKKSRLIFIDFAKAFAILSIVLFHYLSPFFSGAISKAISVGGSGVHLFFLLSGFGLALSSKKISTLGFYKNRLFKILLPYYLVVLLTFVISLYEPIFKYESPLYALAGHIFLFKMFDSSIMESYGPHFWFISTIVQFYIAYPIILKIKKQISESHFLFLIFIISISYWAATALIHVETVRVFNSFFLQYLWEFGLGMVLAERYKKNEYSWWNGNPALYFLLVLVGFGLSAAFALFGGSVGRAFNDIPSLLGITAIACFLFRVLEKTPLVMKIFVTIGNISYEIYLTHLIVFMLISRHLMFSQLSNSTLIIVGLSLVLTLIISYAFSTLNKNLLSKLY